VGIGTHTRAGGSDVATDEATWPPCCYRDSDGISGANFKLSRLPVLVNGGRVPFGSSIVKIASRDGPGKPAAVATLG
jgi:hypothetical protein